MFGSLSSGNESRIASQDFDDDAVNVEDDELSLRTDVLPVDDDEMSVE